MFEDWLFATWRPRAILTRPAAKEFSLEDGLRRFERTFTSARGWTLNWDRSLMPPTMTEAEARFWLHVMRHCNTTSLD